VILWRRYDPMPEAFTRSIGDDAERWCSEYWITEPFETGYPVGLIWVDIFPPDSSRANFILVFDEVRRQGIARALLDAAKERWP
jgi:GNAT superfamily N-acetyltransferase